MFKRVIIYRDMHMQVY